MERRKGLFDEEEGKEEDEVPYLPPSSEEKNEVVIPPKEEEKVEDKAGQDFHEVGLGAADRSVVALISTMEDDLNLDFMVGNPEDRGGHIQYYVKGKDRLGEWEGQRRYNHFFFLHEILC